MTSSSYRLLVHLTHEGKGAGPSPHIPSATFEECKAKYLPLKTRTPRSSEEIVESDIDDDASDDENSPEHFVATPSTAAPSSGASSMKSKVKGSSSSGVGRPPKQTSLAQSVGGVFEPVSFLKQRQRQANIEIDRTVIECNLAFNILRVERW